MPDVGPVRGKVFRGCGTGGWMYRQTAEARNRLQGSGRALESLRQQVRVWAAMGEKEQVRWPRPCRPSRPLVFLL